MNISLEKVGKRYRFEWIFKNIDYQINSGERHAILGMNGSGKSTLMRILSGHLTPSKGQVSYEIDGNVVPNNKIYAHISYAAPYIDLIEELTLREAIHFHQKFKPFINGISIENILGILSLPKSATHKEIRFFSSGMKQRVKLCLSLLTSSSLILLDEPTTNLDTQGMDWYQELVNDYLNDRTIIIASNEERDYTFCNHTLSILDYKPKRKNR